MSYLPRIVGFVLQTTVILLNLIRSYFIPIIYMDHLTEYTSLCIYKQNLLEIMLLFQKSLSMFLILSGPI